MNNVIDEVLDTAQTDNKIKYKIIHADSTEEIVQLELYTPVTTEGTALNKALFDSIQADLNTRLLISNLATQQEAEAGTNNTKYMTPLRVKQGAIKLALPSYHLSIKTGAISNNGTIPQTSGYAHYIYFVTLSDCTGWRTSTSSSGTSYYQNYDVNVNQSTRKVTARIGYATSSSSSSWTYTNGYAKYIEIAWD